MVNRAIPPEIKEFGTVKIPKIGIFKLDNGIKVYALETYMPLVKIIWGFKAGTWLQNKLLVASSTNKMLTEGTKNRTSFQINSQLEYNAAFLKKNTGYHISTQTLWVLEKNLENALEIVADILLNPIFPQKELSVYQQIGKHSLSIEFQKVDYLAQVEFSRVLFGSNHPYGVFAKPDDYLKITQKDLLNYHRDFYTADRAFIVIVANKPEEKIKLLNHYFAQIPVNQNPKQEKEVDIRPYSENRYDFPKEEAVQSALRMGNITINRFHKDYTDLLVANTLLGGYFGSRLMKVIREQKGYTYGIYSSVQSLKYAGIFSIASEIRKEHINEAIDEIFKQIEILKTEPIDAEELQKTKNYILGKFLRDFDGEFKIADYIKNMVAWGMDFEYINRITEKIRNIDAEQIMNTARKYFIPEKMKIITVG